MTRRDVWSTPLDVELLETVAREHSVARACQSLGISRDRGVYRLARLARALHGPVVRATRGGASGGRSELTAIGRRLVRAGVGPVAAPPGRAEALAPTVLIGHGVRGSRSLIEVGGVPIAVAFPVADVDRVAIAIDPENVLLARTPFVSSARNRFVGTVVAVRRLGRRTAGGIVAVSVRIGRWTIRSSVTPEAVRELRIRPGHRLAVQFKATAVRSLPFPSPGRRAG